ncbi:hypothetical protein ALC57_02940 [Trachymyrmex cornetzi]|uniref:Uncharacterized protein n=1 Tax=Trachymyrmex cornetzi TaxID=471704 RepID=A0A151JMU2_9HYME|nr:hypothetical protein ALC57_02940 [Trachymyrmex cornetzi]
MATKSRTYPGMKVDEGMRNSGFRLEGRQHPFTKLRRLIPEHHISRESITGKQAPHETNIRLKQRYFGVLKQNEQNVRINNALIKRGDNDVWSMKAGKLALFSRLRGIVPLIDIYDARCDRKYRGKFVSDTFSRRLYFGTKYFLSTPDYTLDFLPNLQFGYHIIYVM